METELALFGAPLLAGAAWVLDRAERLRRDVARAGEGTIKDLTKMREGLVGIEGRIAPLDQPLTDPVTGKEVVFWRWSVQRSEQTGPVELASRTGRVAFRVTADGAEVIIEPHRAQMRCHESTLEVPVANVSTIAPVGRTDGPTLMAVGGTLDVGAFVYVLGVAERLPGQPGAFRGTADQFRIRAARGMPFVVSSSPEAPLLDGLRRTAHRALVVGAGAFLGGAGLLLAAFG